MKTLLAILLLTGSALAADPGAREPARKSKPAVVTGTNIAQPVRRIGNTYDTPQSIQVIDRTRIERSGASSVVQLLRRQPGVSIR